MSSPPPTYSCIPDEEYDQMMIEVTKTKKKSKWKGRLINTQGTASKIKYHDGELFKWHQRLHQWVTVKPLHRFTNSFQNKGCSTIQTSFIGHVAMEHPGEFNSVFEQVVKSNTTGNHYRNKSAKVPTRAGEPVRG